MKRTVHPVVLLSIAIAAMLLVPASSLAVEDAATAKPAGATATKVDKEDEPSAAERRAESSEFEREKLDQGAFSEAEKEREESGGSSENGGSALRFIFGLVVVLGAIFGVHWLLKKWGQSRLQGVAGTAGVIDVVATTALAQGRALHLVRVGSELVLVGATEQSITRIGEVDASVLATSAGSGSTGAEFQAMLSGSMLGTQPGVPTGMGGAGSAQQPFMKRFVDNLRMTTAR